MKQLLRSELIPIPVKFTEWVGGESVIPRLATAQRPVVNRYSRNGVSTTDLRIGRHAPIFSGEHELIVPSRGSTTQGNSFKVEFKSSKYHRNRKSVERENCG